MGRNELIESQAEDLKSGKIKDRDLVVLTAAEIGWSYTS